MPIYKKPLSSKGHILVLRMSAVFVAIFIFCWSSWFRQTQDILHYFNLTGAIWLGGAGMIIIGGLYTRWGTTAAAFSSLICGSAVAFGGLVCEKYWPAWYGEAFFLTGTYVYFWAMLAAALIYVIVSFAGKRRHFNLDKMLHRGKYTVESDHQKVEEAKPVSARIRLANLLGYTKDFTFFDKVIYGFSYVYSVVLFIFFIVGTTAYFVLGFGDRGWMPFVKIQLIFSVIMAFVIAVWLSIGGVRDAIDLFKGLVVAKRDASDDGVVREDFRQETEDDQQK